MQWEVTVNNDSYQFGVTTGETTNYLYCTATSDGVRVGARDRNSFTIKTGGDNDGYYLYNISGSDERYIGCYNSNDWRCYTSIHNNIKGNNNAFYKKEIVSGAVDPSVTISSESVIVGGTASISYPKGLNINFVSSATAVATVSKTGVVTGVAAGQATITATWAAVADTYNAGSKEFTVSVVEATTFERVTNANQLVVGNEYILVAPGYDKAMGGLGNNIRNSVDVTISEDKVAISTEDVVILTLGGSTDAWTFLASDNSEYIAYSGSSNQLHSSSDATAEASKWKITDEFQLNSANVTGRVLQYNSSQPRFACYKGGERDAVLFVKSGSSTDDKADPEFTFGETTEFTVSLGAEFTVPTLSTAQDFDGTVVYSSSNENVALVDEVTGEVFIGDEEGQAVITASSAATENFKAGRATYTINVYDPNRKGTQANPYTVADVIELNPTSISQAVASNVYVTGYIIGAVNPYDGVLKDVTGSNEIDTNLAIADDPTETENYCTVQLPSGDIRNALKTKEQTYNIRVAKILIKGNIKLYCTKPGVRDLSEGSKIAEQVSISSVGMATYYTDCALDFTSFDNMWAYTASLSGDAITFTRINAVPAETGVLLYNPNGGAATNVVPVAEQPETVSDNKFVGTLDGIAALTGDNYYILNNGSNGLGFYKVNANGSEVGVHRAYLDATGASSRAFIGFADNGTTGIESLQGNSSEQRMEVYNLQGVRVQQPTKGLYIMNGKKVIFK